MRPIEMWRGPWIVLASGYRACAVIYQTGKRSMVLEHREVMEKVLGRELREDEVVHHLDEDKLHNDPSNLQIMSREEHSRLHASKS